MLRLVLAFVVSGFALPVVAEPLTALQTAELSGALYLEGVARGDAVLVLAAARLRKPIGFQPVDRMAPQPLAGVREPLGWQDMLAQAVVLADGDAALSGMIDDLRAEGGKGMASGPYYNIGSLGAGGTDSYPAAEFQGGDYAEAYVEASAATDLNIQIYDASGRLVCEDSDPSPIAYCGWRPAETGRYVMKVENLGPEGATYALMTN